MLNGIFIYITAILRTMTHDELWLSKWRDYMRFLKKNKRSPSKHHPEEMRLVNWAKHDRKLRNKGLLQGKRLERFNELCALSATYRRVNQYAYAHEDKPEDNPSNT